MGRLLALLLVALGLQTYLLFPVGQDVSDVLPTLDVSVLRWLALQYDTHCKHHSGHIKDLCFLRHINNSIILFCCIQNMYCAIK